MRTLRSGHRLTSLVTSLVTPLAALACGGLAALTVSGVACDDGSGTGTTPDLHSTLPDLAAPADLYVTPGPVLTSLSKTRGLTRGGDTLTLTGSGFQAGATVRFGSLPATAVTVSSDGASITLQVPASSGKPGAVDVIVQNPDSQSSAPLKYRYYLEAISFGSEAVVTGPDAGPRHVALGDPSGD